MDAINNPYAKATTPDELIAAKICNLIATDFEAWAATGAWKLPEIERHHKLNWRHYDTTYGESFTLESEKYNVRVTGAVAKKQARYSGSQGYSEYYYYSIIIKDLAVNDVAVDAKVGIPILSDYGKIRMQFEEAQRVAKEAKATMEAEEKKWNLAETLLGMKRNEQGALVPKEAPEEPQV
jgi:hypothetical protein